MKTFAVRKNESLKCCYHVRLLLSRSLKAVLKKLSVDSGTGRLLGVKLIILGRDGDNLKDVGVILRITITASSPPVFDIWRSVLLKPTSRGLQKLEAKHYKSCSKEMFCFSSPLGEPNRVLPSSSASEPCLTRRNALLR